MTALHATTSGRSALHLVAIAEQAKRQRDEAHQRKCTAERDRVQRILSAIELEAYWEELEQVAAIEPTHRTRSNGHTPFEHLLLEQSPDSDILEDTKTHVIMPWIRDKLCNGEAEHGF